MYNQEKSGGAPQNSTRLPIRAMMLSRSVILMLLTFLVASCEKIELPSVDAPAPDAVDKQGESAPSDLTVPLPTEVVEVDIIPSPCSVWQGHIVALTEPITTVPDESGTATEALITLISLYDWGNLPSALNATNPTLASTIAEGYQEYDLSDWRIPTSVQAKAFKAAYTSTQSSGSVLGVNGFENLNALLLTLEASELHLTVGAANVRYLCEDATRTFSFVPSTTISSAGAKATNYRLRLVKTLRFRQKL